MSITRLSSPAAQKEAVNSPSRFEKRVRRSKPSRVSVSVHNQARSLLNQWHSHLKPLLPTQDLRILYMVSAILAGMTLATVLSISLWMFQHSECYTREIAVSWQEGQIHNMTRPCRPVSYPTTQPIDRNRICLTTLTDSHVSHFTWHKLVSCRDFGRIGTHHNLQDYALRHGYRFQDQSHLLDSSRPPAWSKILAVQDLFDDGCDWVLWMDADAVIMNSTIELESRIPAPDSGIDLVVTHDRRFTANSGVWLLRNSQFGRDFLKQWWGSKSYIRAKGLSLSGDNDAFGHVIRRLLDLPRYPTPDQVQVATLESNIRMPERCNLNSFGVFVETEDAPRYFGSQNYYHEGDFVAHASGIDQKSVAVELLLQRAR